MAVSRSERETPSMDVAAMAEGDRVVGVRVAHGWDAEAGTPLVLLQLRTDAGGVGLVSLSADLAQTLVDQIGATLERFGIERPPAHPQLTAEALRTAFAGGETVTSIARIAGVDRETVRKALQRHGIGGRMSIHAIADELGAADNTVARALKRHGVPVRCRADRPVRIGPEWLRRRYVDDRLTLAEIARLSGASRSTVHRAVVAYGLVGQGRGPGRRAAG